MTRNPYAHPTEDEPLLRDDSRARVSGLAVSSLIFGILCCIPGSGLIGTILGGAGLVSISRSEGRLSGRTLAFVGVVLGILGTVLWLAVGIGARRELAILQTRLVDPSVATMKALGSQDWKGAAKLFDPKSGIGEAELRDFAARLEAAFGAPVGAPVSMNWEQVFGPRPSAAVEAAGTNALPLPVPIEFKNGSASIVLVLRSPTVFGEVAFGGGSLDGQVTNVGVVGPDKEVWLVDPAAGKRGRGGGGGTVPGSK